MSVTKMTTKLKEALTKKTATATTTTNNKKSETKTTAVAHWLNQKDETTFKLKQALTLIHFISLLLTAIVYLSNKEGYQARAFILSFGTFVLSFCIPPIGMITPDDAPKAAKSAMGWMPERPDVDKLKRDMMTMKKNEAETNDDSGNDKGKKNKKRNFGKGNNNKKVN